ncbi:MAG TPA: glycosyltransferase family 39 protein [Pyrinomonadaceae bacterium]|nr:glycosyltransferase family 39 protein [Pyrinomonadaceae bacterium]
MSRPIGLDSEKGGGLALSVEARPLGLTGALERRAALVLCVLALLGFGLRVGGLGAVGFAEDEVNKLEAVRAYGRGAWSENSEHPMLMKGLIFVSMGVARWWSPEGGISDEAALRFPNALFGALTVVPLFLLTSALFNRRTGLLAAALWAFGINAITYNRIGKEDTLLVFFMLSAFYFYLRAKQTSGFKQQAKGRAYTLSAVSFGLMLASKYFPHYFGLNMLYHHFARVRRREPGEPRGRTPRLFYVLVLLTFVAVNPAVLLPETWAYLSAYSSEQLLTHHGYLMGERLYENTMSATPFGGTPVYFYLLFLVIKVPLPLLVAFACGLVYCARRWREPGAAFLLLMLVLWIVPYSLAGAKWLRYTLTLMPFVYMTAAVGIVALVRGAAGWLAARGLSPMTHAPLVATLVAVLVFVVAPTYTVYKKMPLYALYTNALAPQTAGRFFPHDEFYDAGLREAIAHVARVAPRGALIAHETPGVVRYYLDKFGRTDLQPRVISDARFDARLAPTGAFIIMQRGRTYFENREELEHIRTSARFRKDYEVLLRGARAAEVYVASD